MGGFPRSRMHSNIRHWHENWYHCPSPVPFGRDFFYNIMTGRSVWNPYDLTAVDRALPNEEPVPVTPPLEANTNQLCFGNCTHFLKACSWCQGSGPRRGLLGLNIEVYDNQNPAAEACSASVSIEQNQNTDGRTKETPDGWQDTNDLQNYLHNDSQNYRQYYQQNYPLNDPQNLQSSYQPGVIRTGWCCTHCNSAQNNPLLPKETNREVMEYLLNVYLDVRRCDRVPREDQRSNESLSVFDAQANGPVKLIVIPRSALSALLYKQSTPKQDGCSHTLTRVDPETINEIIRGLILADEPINRCASGSQRPIIKMQSRLNKAIVRKTVVLDASVSVYQEPPTSVTCSACEDRTYFGVNSDGASMVEDVPVYSYSFTQLDVTPLKEIASGSDKQNIWYIVVGMNTLMNMFKSSDVEADSDDGRHQEIPERILTQIQAYTIQSDNVDTRRGQRLIAHKMNIGYAFTAEEPDRAVEFNDVMVVLTTYLEMPLNHDKDLVSNKSTTNMLTTEPSCTTDRTSQASTDVDPSDTNRRSGAIPKEKQPKKTKKTKRTKKKKSSKMIDCNFDTVWGQTMTDEYKEIERYTHSLQPQGNEPHVSLNESRNQVPSHQGVDTGTINVTVQNSDVNASKPRRVIKIITKSNSVEQCKEYVEAPEDSDDPPIETRTIIKVIKEPPASLIEEALTCWNICKNKTDREKAKHLARAIVTIADEAAEDYSKSVINEASNLKRMTTTQLEDLKGAASQIQSNNMNGQTEKVNPESNIKVICLARYILITTMMIDSMVDKMKEAGIIKPKTSAAAPSTTNASSDWQGHCQVLCDEWISFFINLCRYIHNPSDDFAQDRFLNTFTKDTGIVVHEITTLHESLRLFGIKFRNPIIKYALLKLSSIIITCMDRKDKLKEKPPRMYYVYLGGYCIFIMEMLMITEGSKKDIDLLDNYLTKNISASPDLLVIIQGMRRMLVRPSSQPTSTDFAQLLLEVSEGEGGSLKANVLCPPVSR